MEGLRLGGRRAFAPLLDSGLSLNSDYYPVLDLGAERTRFQRTTAEGIIALGSSRFPLGLVLSGYRTAFATSTASPVQIRRSEARAFGAAVRAPAAVADTGAFEELRTVRHLRTMLRAQTASGRAPEHWDRWVSDVLSVDDAIHGGTAGVADDAWYAELTDYVRRVGAPERVTTTLTFLRAVRAWDWPTVATSGEQLMMLGATPPVAGGPGPRGGGGRGRGRRSRPSCCVTPSSWRACGWAMRMARGASSMPSRRASGAPPATPGTGSSTRGSATPRPP
jgi:hypothetical protein